MQEALDALESAEEEHENRKREIHYAEENYREWSNKKQSETAVLEQLVSVYAAKEDNQRSNLNTTDL